MCGLLETRIELPRNGLNIISLAFGSLGELRGLEEVLLENAAAFEPADVIVSTTGNWASIAALCDWGRSASSKPVVVGWTEPHACAGHAVAIVGDDACIHCGFDCESACKILDAV